MENGMVVPQRIKSNEYYWPVHWEIKMINFMLCEVVLNHKLKKIE